MLVGSVAATQGLFSTSQLMRISDALAAADKQTGFAFSVYVGELETPTQAHAQKLHAQLSSPAASVLLAIAPNQRLLEIVTGEQVRQRLSDRCCGLAAVSMASSLAGGDLAGSIVVGMHMLADRARR